MIRALSCLVSSIAAAALLIAPALTSSATAAESVGGDNAFSFVALGDMPYNLPGDYVKFDRLIAAINTMKPAFTLHMGDIKSGGTPCSDEVLKKSYDQMQTFAGALIYTIGDNEWTDCHRKAAGSFDPRERLAKVREMFFTTPNKSLGKTPIDVEKSGSGHAGLFNLRGEHTLRQEQRAVRQRARGRLKQWL